MPLSLADRLAAAEQAYDDLLTGKSVAEVRDANGEIIRYNAANAGRLAAYIQNIKNQISGTPSGPMKTFFA